LDRIKTGVRLALHRDDIKNSNIIGQNFIQPEKQVEIPILLNIRVEKELAGVYQRIRSPASDNGNCFFEQFA